VPNIPNEGLSDAERRFIGDVARLLTPWGVPLAAARLYGYLLLAPEPVSLDQMAVDLEMSKSSASVAARLLEMYTLARRHGQRGSRRILYEASDNFEGMLAGQNRMLQEGARLLRDGARVAGPEQVRRRLEKMAEFYLVTRDAMEAALRQWRERRRL
jgi:hypothetical protein